METPGQCLPEKAGLIGIITFEDVLEMLLQEEIYDEMDKEQRAAHRLAELVWRRWKIYVEKRDALRSETKQQEESQGDVEQQFVGGSKNRSRSGLFAAQSRPEDSTTPTERTALL